MKRIQIQAPTPTPSPDTIVLPGRAEVRITTRVRVTGISGDIGLDVAYTIIGAPSVRFEGDGHRHDVKGKHSAGKDFSDLWDDLVLVQDGGATMAGVVIEVRVEAPSDPEVLPESRTCTIRVHAGAEATR